MNRISEVRTAARKKRSFSFYYFYLCFFRPTLAHRSGSIIWNGRTMARSAGDCTRVQWGEVAEERENSVGRDYFRVRLGRYRGDNGITKWTGESVAAFGLRHTAFSARIIHDRNVRTHDRGAKSYERSANNEKIGGARGRRERLLHARIR